MASILSNLFGNSDSEMKIADETLVFSMMEAAAATSMAYLTATLDSITPEVRRMLNDYTNQVIMEHEAITTLAINKGWYIPYETPMKQLKTSLENTYSVMNNSNKQ